MNRCDFSSFYSHYFFADLVISKVFPYRQLSQVTRSEVIVKVQSNHTAKEMDLRRFLVELKYNTVVYARPCVCEYVKECDSKLNLHGIRHALFTFSSDTGRFLQH